MIQEVLAMFGIFWNALNNLGFDGFMKILFGFEISVDELRI